MISRVETGCIEMNEGGVEIRIIFGWKEAGRWLDFMGGGR